ncbi:hypothetical protein D3C87_1607200 [compost metagenome]
MGTIISLLIKEPLVIAQSTGSSLDDKKPVAFSAFTARSSPSIPAVFRVAILAVTATSSINAAISSKIAKKPDAICYLINKAAKYLLKLVL